MSRTVTYYMEINADGTVRGAGEAEKSLEKVEKQTEKTSAATVAMGAAMAMAAAKAASMFGQLVAGATEAFQRQEEAEQRITAVVQATGEAAGYSSQQLFQMAAQMQEMTRFGDEHIMESMAMMLTFRSVQGETFERAMHSATDLAEIFGSLESATMQLGKALEDPVQGVSALRRVGVSFNDTQMEMIKQFTEMNDLASAQALILDVVEGQVGGVAAAMANTPTGQWQQFMNRLGDGQEELGRFIVSLRAEFLPLFERGLEIGLATLERMNTGLSFVRQNAQQLRPAFLGIVSVLGIAGSAWLVYTAYVNAAMIATAAATGGLYLIIAALGALGGVLVFSEQGFDGLSNVVMGFFDMIMIGFRNLPTVARDIFLLLFEIMTFPMQQAFDVYTTIFDSLIGGFSTFVQIFHALMRGDFAGAWNLAKGFAIDAIGDITDSFTKGFDRIGERVDNLVTNTDFSPATDRMREGASQIANAFIETFSFTMAEAEDQGLLSLIGTEESREEELELFGVHLESLSERLNENLQLGNDLQQESSKQRLQGILAHVNATTNAYNAETQARIDALNRQREAEISYTRLLITQNMSRIKSFKDVARAVIDSVRDSIRAKAQEAAAVQFAEVISSTPWPINVLLATGAAALVAGIVNNMLPSFATGGMVPVRVSNGEYVFDPRTAAANRGAIERANASPAYAHTLSGLISGPGTGTSDSITTALPAGSYVLNARSTSAMLSRAEGGWIGPAMSSGSSRTESMMASALRMLSERLENIQVHVRGEIRNEAIYLSNEDYQEQLADNRL